MSEVALVPATTTPASLEWLRAAVLATVTSPHSKRNYAKAYDELAGYLAGTGEPLSRTSLFAYRNQFLDRGLSPSTINVQLSAVRKLVA